MHYGVTSAEASNNQFQPTDPHPVCLLDGTPPLAREQRRMRALEQLKLTESAPIPIFEEAAQSVARLLAVPICLVSVFEKHNQIFKATMGLSSLGLMNQLAATRELPKTESFGIQVVDSGQSLMLSDVAQHPAFSQSILVQKYGVQAYLGVPLMTSERCCIGTLEIMDIMPRQYTQQDLALLELNARWAMSEYEKQCWLEDGTIQQTIVNSQPISAPEEKLQGKIDTLRMSLISQLTQDLRNPLTAITGMAGMLSRKIYGPLTEKQQEYANVVLNSSQNLLSLTNEIMELGSLEHQPRELFLSPVDIEMLAQQSLQPVEFSYKQKDLAFNLSVEPGSRIWVLDKRIIKQLIYNLTLSIAKASAEGSTIRIHISRRDDRLTLAIWVSNPWLGEDLPQTVINWGRQNSILPPMPPVDAAYGFEAIENVSTPISSKSVNESDAIDIRQELGLLLSQRLTDIHDGDITIQGSQNHGYRYVVSFPPFDVG
ncbi:GAF domain-containing sensor histidine kinase [Leptolyngbya cf. ectocarpi LEGE 11479]|uniref:histidine kinase n=1 Tax=Leptolyngbya cf. ectocarpi LEGE 11479 TaxID=1828722 RepID=A0A928ZVP7_LEPEC|nr:GAF domain-containing sensor histidine kinase [Leptolyngbya ectocarpi]MBE9068321.1 GAF domain-containing sensor histidine kinase [Leptolyngbya cf. ectocarpi LEGE 11479]